MRTLTSSERQALRDTCWQLHVDPRSLAALIEFESRWDPQIKNPTSSARGLIQFMDLTSYYLGFYGPDDHNRALGASLALVTAHPTVESQLLGPVRDYLRPMAPFTDRAPTLEGQSLFLAVFYPRARTWRPDRSFPASVTKANPGITCPADYVAHVLRRAGQITEEEVTP